MATSRLGGGRGAYSMNTPCGVGRTFNRKPQSHDLESLGLYEDYETAKQFLSTFKSFESYLRSIWMNSSVASYSSHETDDRITFILGEER